MRQVSPGPVEAAAVALSMILLSAAPAHAVDCYGAGNRALDDGRQADAVLAFEVAAELPECASSKAGLLHSKAVALHEMTRVGDDPSLACRAAAAYKLVIGLEPTSRVGQASKGALAEVEARCKEVSGASADPRPPAAAPSDRTLEWGLTIGAGATAAVGGVLLVLALEAADERDAADRRIVQAISTNDTEAEAAARADFTSAGDRTDALGISAYTLLGVGGALAVGAVIAWVVDDGGSSVSVVPGPNGLVMVGHW